MYIQDFCLLVNIYIYIFTFCHNPNLLFFILCPFHSFDGPIELLQNANSDSKCIMKYISKIFTFCHNPNLKQLLFILCTNFRMNGPIEILQNDLKYDTIGNRDEWASRNVPKLLGIKSLTKSQK